MFSGEVFIKLLDAFVPDWFAFASGFFTGALGVAAFSIIVLFFAPSGLAAWMLLIVFFCGASAGYKFWEKRKSGVIAWQILFCLAAGISTGATGAVIQMSVDDNMFHASTPGILIAGIGLASVLGALLGGALRHRYERISNKTGGGSSRSPDPLYIRNSYQEKK